MQDLSAEESEVRLACKEALAGALGSTTLLSSCLDNKQELRKGSIIFEGFSNPRMRSARVFCRGASLGRCRPHAVGASRARLRRSLATDQKPPFEFQIATLPEAEFKKLAAAVGRRLEKETNMSGQAIAAEADLNHDGVVTEAELSAWWRRRASTLLAVSASRATEPPSRSQLMKLGLVAAVPCFTFGFLDNAIMLVAGEQIEAHLGMSLGLSAMACAAMGNIVADTTGQVSGGTVERLLRPVLPCANLSAAQRATASATRVHALGGALGIIVGCVFGMFPLLFYEDPTPFPPADCGCDD